MDRKEKIQLLLDMQEYPEKFSEQALRAMLDDPEMGEMMEATAQLKQAMINNENDIEIDTEWQRFLQTHPIEKKSERNILKIAAIFIGILMISGITFAAIHIIRHSSNVINNPQVSTKETTIVNSNKLSAVDIVKTDTIPQNVIRYDETKLEQILTDMADYYGLTLNWKSKEAKTLRLFYIWNKQQSASEAINSINSFERIHLELIDNILIVEIQTNTPK